MKPVYAKFASTPELQDLVAAGPGDAVGRRSGGAAAARFRCRTRARSAGRDRHELGSSLNPHVEDIVNAQLAAAPRLTGPLTRFNATVARYGMYLSVAGLLVIVAIVFYQVFGRYVLNSSPTWAENLALVLILYVTLIGAAVGVRDAGHIGMESLLVLAAGPAARPDRDADPRAGRAVRRRHGLQRLDPRQVGHALQDRQPRPVARPCATCRSSLSGVLIVLFSIEHIIALLRGKEVEPSWH